MKPISTLTLGTVQFGMNYGIANQAGKPDYETCRKIVACALENGISCFDTAAGYGDSEKILGSILAELKATDEVVVVSKSAPVSDASVPAADVEAFIEASLRKSLSNLQMEVLPYFLFHRDQDLVWMNAMQAMREKGLVKYVGVSVSTLRGAAEAARNDFVEAIQLPYNLLDRRFVSTELLGQAGFGEVKVFARSAFLQGLLLMSEERIPESLGVVVPIRRNLQKLAAESGMSMVELCLRYSLSCPAISSVVIGVDSPTQLQENIDMARRGKLDDSTLAAILACAPELPDSIVSPRCWEK